MKTQEAEIITEMLSVMRYFPSAEAARAVITAEIQCMCGTHQQGRWLVNRMTRLYQEWPGLVELRAVYCAKFPPADGIEGLCGTASFPDGIPPEKQIEAPPMLQLPPGTHSADPQLAGIVDEVIDATRMKANRKPPVSAAVTDADVAEVLERQRRNQERVSEVRTAFGQ